MDSDELNKRLDKTCKDHSGHITPSDNPADLLLLLVDHAGSGGCCPSSDVMSETALPLLMDPKSTPRVVISLLLLHMTDSERMQVLSDFDEAYCRYCGTVNPRCQCNNDD